METLIPMIAVGGGLAIGPIIVAIVMWADYRKALLRNKERLAAIEKGIPLTDLSEKNEPTRSSGQRSLRRGIMLLFIGTGLAGALYVTGGATLAVWGGFVAFIGLGHLFYWFFVGRDESSGPSGSA
jgi:Domain of unknown function (DUF6249)